MWEHHRTTVATYRIIMNKKENHFENSVLLFYRKGLPSLWYQLVLHIVGINGQLSVEFRIGIYVECESQVLFLFRKRYKFLFIYLTKKQSTMSTTGVLPFVRSVDFSRNDFSVKNRHSNRPLTNFYNVCRTNFLKIWL